MIQIYVYKNSLKIDEGKDKYCFRSVVDQTIDSEQLIKEITRYNSTITEADARAVLSVLNDRVKYFANLGYKVELPFGYIYNKANGTVPKLNDGFTPGNSNHRISAVFKFKDDAAKEIVKNAAYKMAGSGYVRFPVIKEACSILPDGKESEELTFAAGSMLRLKGKYVSFDAEDTLQGVFLVSAGGNEVRISNYNHIGSNIIEAYIPSDTVSGVYEVRIATKSAAGRYEKSVLSESIVITG